MGFKKIKRIRQKIKPAHDAQRSEKNYFIAFFLALLFWTGTIATTLWSIPSAITIVIFFAILSLALAITFSILFGNTRRGLLITAVIIIFLLLRLIKLGNLLNLTLLIGSALSFELYRKG